MSYETDKVVKSTYTILGLFEINQMPILSLETTIHRQNTEFGVQNLKACVILSIRMCQFIKTRSFTDGEGQFYLQQVKTREKPL